MHIVGPHVVRRIDDDLFGVDELQRVRGAVSGNDCLIVARYVAGRINIHVDNCDTDHPDFVAKARYHDSSLHTRTAT